MPAAGLAAEVRALVVPTMLGLAAVGALLLLFVGLGQLAGRSPTIPWICDDTRYVDTVPVGRGVVGPSVSVPPGCGD